MKTTVIAATLALLLGTPLAASASEIVPSTSSAAMLSCDGMLVGRDAGQFSNGCGTKAKQPAPPRFVGPFELHNGLLPNGLTPTPFNYG